MIRALWMVPCHGSQTCRGGDLDREEFMRRRGWNDEATETLNRRKREAASRIAMISARCLTVLTRTREGLCQKERRGRRAHCPAVQNSWVISKS